MWGASAPPLLRRCYAKRYKKRSLRKKAKSQGKKKGLKGAKLNAYIYGTLTKVMGPKGAKKASKSGKIRAKKKK